MDAVHIPTHRATLQIVALSKWVDGAEVNRRKDPEALTWHRVTKVAEEAGEAVGAMVGFSGGNPRKGQSHTRDDVIEECLDTAVAALGAVEHLTGHAGVSIELLLAKIDRVFTRARDIGL